MYLIISIFLLFNQWLLGIQSSLIIIVIIVVHYYYKAWPKLFVVVCWWSLLRVSFFCPYLGFFFYPKPLFPRWAMWLQSNGLFLSRKIQTQVTDGGMGARGEGGWGHRFLEILYPPPTVYFFFWNCSFNTQVICIECLRSQRHTGELFYY